MRTTWIPLVFLFSGWMLVFTIWVILNQSDSRQIRFETSSVSESIQLQLESCVQNHTALVDSISSRGWADQDDVIKNWSAATLPILNVYPGIKAVNYVDREGVIRVVSPLIGNEAALGKNLFDNTDPDVPRALNEAKRREETVRTNTINLLQSGRGFVAYKQLFAGDKQFVGFINSVFRIDSLMESCLRGEFIDQQYRYQLIEPEKNILIYSHTDQQESTEWEFEVNRLVQVLDMPWHLRFAPKTTHVNSHNDSLDEVLSLVGASLTLLLAWAIRTLLMRQSSLLESEARYRFLIENQSDLVVHYSSDMEVIYASPNYCQLHGKSREEIVGSHFAPEIHQEDQKIFDDSQVRLSDPPFASQYDRMREKIDGDWRWFGWSSSGAVDEHGQLETVTAIGRDITELMRMEVQISQAQKMQAVGQMAGGISHDFNNLLQVMLANVEFVLDDLPLDSPLNDDLMRVRQSISRAMDLSKKLGSLNRQRAPGVDIIDLESLMVQFVELLSRTIPSSIQIRYMPSTTLLKIRADASEFEQVLLNLCFNARDSIEGNGSIWISINQAKMDAQFRRRYPELTDNAYVCISITDDGCGIDPESLARIFDPFYTTKAAGSGTGLGLTNCYSIVKQHDGLILADSKVGSGSTFRVYLPLTDEALSQKVGEEKLTNSAAKGEQQILVVDDDKDVLGLTARTLESAGYQTLRAANGEEALTLLRQKEMNITLVVLDLVMPIMDGRSTGAIIGVEFPHVKILYVSGYDPESQTPEAAPLNGPLLRKPYRAVELHEAAQQLLNSAT